MGKNALILLGEAVIGAVAGIVISNVVDKSEREASAVLKRKIERNRTEKEREILREYACISKELADFLKKENTEVREEVSKYCKSRDLADARKRLYSAADTKLEDFKAAIDYEANVNRIKEEAEKSIEKYKNDISYDNKMTEFNSEELSIKQEYDTQKTWIKLSSKDEEAAKELTKKAKKIRNSKLDKVNQQKHFLEERFSNYEKGANYRRDKEIEKLDSVVSNKKKTFYDEAEASIKKIDSEVEAVTEEIRTKAVENRPSRIQDKFDRCDDLKISGTEIEVREINRANEILKTMTQQDKLVEYLKDKDISSGTVWFFGLAPVVFVVHFVGTWIFKVAKIATAVAKR